MSILKRVVGLLGMTVLTIFAIYIAQILLILTMCTLGGALIAIIPMGKMFIPWYMRTVKYLITGNSKYLQLPADKNGLPPQPNNSITQYVLNARSYGATDTIIRTTLLKEGGWSEVDVHKAFDEVNGIQVPKIINNTH